MSKTRKRPWIKWIFLGPLLIVTVVQLYFLAMVCWYNFVNPRMTNMMSDQLAVLREKNPKATLQQKWVPYAAISNNLKRAVIASEDANFADHDGVDWEALQKAYERNNRKHKVVGGGSTITQQLAKNLFLSGSRNYIRKVTARGGCAGADEGRHADADAGRCRQPAPQRPDDHRPGHTRPRQYLRPGTDRCPQGRGGGTGRHLAGATDTGCLALRH